MALEIERRFLVDGHQWQEFAHGQREIRQGYLVTGQDGLTLRIRLARPLQGSEAAFLTLKAPPPGPEAQLLKTGEALARLEFEYAIPASDGEALLALSPHRLIKSRHALDLPGGDWVLDVFAGANAPLVVAEVELEREDQPVPVPAWCWREITGRRDLSNAALARRPLSTWPAEQRRALEAEAG